MDADRMSSRLATPQSVARSVAGSVVSSSRASSSIYSSLTGSWLILIDRSRIWQELILSCRSHLKCRKVFDMERCEVVGEWFWTPNAASKREKGLYSKFQRLQVERNVPIALLRPSKRLLSSIPSWVLLLQVGARRHSRGCLPFSARDPRAFPLAGASKEHERLHRQIHDDAAGKRISWWLRQRDKSNEARSRQNLLRICFFCCGGNWVHMLLWFVDVFWMFFAWLSRKS